MDIVPPAPAKDLFLLMHCSEPSGPREANSYCKVMIFKTDGLRRVKSEQLLRDVESRKVYKHLLEEAEKWRKKVKELEEGFKELKMESLQHSFRGKLYFNALPSEWQTDHIEKNTILCTITNTESRSLPYLDDPNGDADDDAEDEFEDEEEFGNQIKFLSKRIIGMKLEVKYLEPYLQSTQEMYAHQAKMPYCELIRVGHPTEEHVPCHQRPSSSLSSATKSTYQEEMHLLGSMPSACSATESTGQGKSTERHIPLQLGCESTQRRSQNLRLPSKSLPQTIERKMGTGILASLVDAAVSKVIAVASDMFNLALGWNEDLTKLCDTMERLRGFLQDANEKNVSGHPHLKLWLQDLRDIANEADDMLEEVAYEGMQREAKKSKVRRLTLPDLSPLLFRWKMANRVKDLNKRLDDISRRAEWFELQNKLANIVPEPRGRASRETNPFLSSQVFGREEDVSKIVNLLVDSSSQQDLPVVIIVGMAGLGKTTIAKAVLENDKIRKYFGDNKMWLYVSENFDVKKILMEMLKSCGGSSGGDGDFGGKGIMMRKIQEKLGEENYLLVLDDVWNEERQMWEDLRECLLGISKKKESRSKVLVTTRIEKVASLMALTDEHIHRPHLLKEDECWTIIKQRAFGDNSVPKGLDGIGKQIARRCKGIPLVASIIGALLQNKRDKREWQAITENRVWDSLEKEEGILDIIKYSYDRLPTLALKQCFAFCSIFPKDFVMQREMLIQLWMALGFLESFEEHHMATEDIGDKYFRYLLSYSLFQEERRDDVTGIVESCKMHDLIHDFAQSISKSETLIVEEWFGSNFSHDVRHLNLIDGREMVPTILGDVAKRLQTLFSKHSFSNDVQVELPRLRVLSLEDAYDAKQLPTCFGNLKRLRYLDISNTQIEELPEFISELYNLQTFRFLDCRSLTLPPRGIGDLFNLKHIYFNDEERMPANLGRLTNLQTLPIFYVGTTEGHKIAELGGLRELKGSLKICKLELVTGKSEAEGANLKEKVVEHLIFCWSKGNGNQDEDVLEGLQPPSNIRRLSIYGYGGRNLASWMLLLNNLVDLEIFNCKMLHRIPDVNGFLFLHRLHIQSCDELTSLIDGDEALTLMSLKELHLSNCCKLKFIPSLEGLFFLKKVIITNCDRLEYLPTGLSSCTALEKLEIYSCFNLVSVPKELKHLPSLVEVRIRDCLNLRSFPEDILCSLSCLKILELGPFSEELEEFPGLSSTSTPITAPLEVLCLRGWGKSLTLQHQIQCLTALRELTITSFNGVEKALLGNLSCLETLEIKDCSQLSCLSGELSSIEDLKVTNCPNLVFFQEELKELRSLEILGCPKLVGFLEKSLSCCTRLKRLVIGRFSEELGEFPSLSSIHASLEDLTLWGWEKLTHLPQIQHLTALKELGIKGFNGMESLPDWFNNLSSLQKLCIWDCSNNLKERCIKGSGPDWHKISHIPYIMIQFENEAKRCG